MLEVLVLALSVMEEEAAAFGLHINWSKIVQFCNPGTLFNSPLVQVADGQVEVVDSFLYLGSTIESTCMAAEQRIELARSCMNLKKNLEI